MTDRECRDMDRIGLYEKERGCRANGRFFPADPDSDRKTDMEKHTTPCKGPGSSVKE